MPSSLVCGSGLRSLALAATGLFFSSPQMAQVVFTFDTSPTLSPTPVPGAWAVDRYAPAGFDSVFFDGDNRLRHSISAADGEVGRPSAFSSTFYNTQGRQYLIPNTTTIQADLYIPSDWASTERRMAGLWGTAVDETDTISAFPIVEFISTTDGSGLPRFRHWNGTGCTDMGLPTGFAYDSWYTLGITLQADSEFEFTVGDLSFTSTTFALGNSTDFRNIILQGHNDNAGVSYDIYWDNVVIPEPATLALMAVGATALLARRRAARKAPAA